MKAKSPKAIKSVLENFTSEQLYAELSRRTEAEYLSKIKSLNINGITVKDFVVKYADWNYYPDDIEFRPHFSFYLKHKGKEYCIYYDYSPSLKWWPIKKDELSNDDYGYAGNGAFDFIPSGFAEAVENGYEFHGTIEEGIERLREYGFPTIIDDQASTGLI